MSDPAASSGSDLPRVLTPRQALDEAIGVILDASAKIGPNDPRRDEALSVLDSALVQIIDAINAIDA